MSGTVSDLWALTDNLGSVRDVVDSDGKARIHRNFDAFGNVVDETHYNASGATVTSGQTGYVDEAFAFTGRYFDKATGLQNNVNRWYDPAVGRWTSQDPSGFPAGDANLYRYVGNQPTNRTDPSGLWFGGNTIIVFPPWPWGSPNKQPQPQERPPTPPTPAGVQNIGFLEGCFKHYRYFLTPGNSAPADPWYLNWGSEIGGGVAVVSGGGAALGPEITVGTGGCFRIYLRTLQTGIRRDPAHHFKPHGHWHFPWNWGG